MLILKIAIVTVGWLLGFIANKKHRQVFLAIPALITVAVLFFDNSQIKNLANTVKSLFDSYTPIEKTSLERYPDLPKEKAIKKYLDDLDKIGLDNKQLRDEQVKNIRKIESLEKEDFKNKRQFSDIKMKTSEQQLKIDIVQEFTEVASWGPGGGIDLGGGTGVAGPLGNQLNKDIAYHGEMLIWQCDSGALNDYKRIIKQYPNYPFPYLYVGECLKRTQDPSWKSYALKGIELFTKTTSIPKHSVTHDGGLKWLKLIAQERAKTISSN